VDVTGDGINDIISGCYVADEEREKGIAYQHVIAGKADGSFEKATPIKAADGKPLILPGINGDDRYDRSRICTHPFACDWDGDGDLDLLVGNFQGTFYLAENIGSATSPSWKSQGEWIKGGDGKLLGRGQKKISKSAPFVIDWDGDGDLDILTGSGGGGAQWAENSGTRKQPSFNSFQQLIEKPKPVRRRFFESEEEILPSNRTHLWVADINGDGVHDLLLGDSVSYWRKKEGLSKEKFNQFITYWNAEHAEITKAWRELGPKPDKKSEKYNQVSERSKKLHKKNMEHVTIESTGFVWLYLGQ